MADREYREITQADVGKSVFTAFGRDWPVADFIGRIFDVDVGRRVYRNGEFVVSVEKVERFKERLRAERAAEPRGSNAARLADLFYATLSERCTGGSSLGIERVRRPNAGLRDHIEVVFADGRDVIVWFEENGGR
jgi:hypothetical protein